ncbi:MAG TPA: plastocyanin/azurin family copper-binding protein [Acidimicrobiia bacterium]|nr:plastocyanin/azurin family copper-binding protein [Acidimicrobiia bacterium]
MVATVVVGALAFAACGGGDDDDAGGGYVEPKGPATETVTVKAGNIFFDPETVTAAAGVTKLTLQGIAGGHTLVFDDAYPGFQLEISGDSTDAKKIDLKPGKYTYYCDVLGHRAAGMEGTLTVK